MVTPPPYPMVGKGLAQIPPEGIPVRQVEAIDSTSPAPYPTNHVQREDAKLSPDLASGLFCYVPLHKIWYGIS